VYYEGWMPEVLRVVDNKLLKNYMFYASFFETLKTFYNSLLQIAVHNFYSKSFTLLR